MSLVTTSEIVEMIISDLIFALTTLVNVPSIAKGQVPPTISAQLEIVDKVSNQIAQEVIDLRSHVRTKIDLDSPDKAAEQLRQLALGWKRYEPPLIDAVRKVQTSGTRTGDPKMDATLALLPNGLKRLQNVLRSLESIQVKHLTPHEQTWEGPPNPDYNYKLPLKDLDSDE